MNAWLAKTFAETGTTPPPQNALDFAELYVRLPGSARSERFSRLVSPWTAEPILSATSGECRFVSLVKPVQCGGSVGGEVAACYWAATDNSGGECQWNWEDDMKAWDRWDKRLERILKACKPVMDRAPSLDKVLGKWTKGKIIFPHMNFVVQGVFNSKRLDSDTITYQINEEVHGWKPGFLEKAYKRGSAVWNAISFNISNASLKGDQLHQAFLSGTQQHWEVKCPGCGSYHVMRTRWDEKEANLGGLRYDANGCRMGDGEYDYNKLAPTIFYQMPCGHRIKDDQQARKQLSLSGRYGQPRNPGAHTSNRSYTLDAVSVDFIPWLMLIQEKHTALRSLQLGDPQPWWKYLNERECRFVDQEEDMPIVKRVNLNLSIKKNRIGLANRYMRFGALDYQKGKFGEGKHWWGVIRDFDAAANSLLVFEGKILSGHDAADIMEQHEVPPACVCVDSGYDATSVYEFCNAHGFDAIKGEDVPHFSHGNQGYRIFSVEEPLWKMMEGGRPTRDNRHEEPLFYRYSKSGIHQRLHWLRSSTAVNFGVPGDVSEDYLRHMDSIEYIVKRKPSTGETYLELNFKRERYDLAVCEAYITLQADRAGIIGAQVMGEKQRKAA